MRGAAAAPERRVESTLGGRFVSAAGSQARTVLTICEALRTHIHHRYKCLNKCPLSGGSAQAYAPPAMEMALLSDSA